MSNNQNTLSSSKTMGALSVEEGVESIQEYCDKLIKSLPKIPNWVRSHCYKYDGFWYWEDRLRSVLSCKKHFRVQDSDILLASFPKCGTTWLKAIMYTIVNRHRNPIGSEDHPLLTNNPHALLRSFENDLYVNNAIPDLSNMPAPRLFATHSPALSLSDEVMNSGCKIIYVCRNPKDCFISLWHFGNKLKPAGANTISLDEFFDSFCSGEAVYGPFWDHVLEHWKASLAMPEKVMFLLYEQISERPDHYVKKMAEFMGCPFSAVEEDEGVVNGVVKMCSFGHLSQLQVNKSGKTHLGVEHRSFFRRGEIGDSNNLLSCEMIEKIDQIAHDKFSPYGLKI